MPQLSYTLRQLPFSVELRALAALVAIGMRIRIGSKKRAELERWMLQPSTDDDAFWADAETEAIAEATSVREWLAGDDRANAGAMLLRRDRLESAFVAIGAAALAGSELAGTCERALGAILDRIDTDAKGRADLRERVRGSDLSELRTSARLDASTWWLDEAALEPVSKGGDLLRALRERRKSVALPTTGDLALRMVASRLAKTAPDTQARLYADVVGQEEEGAPPGVALVARLCDDEVEIVALCLADDDSPPGLLVHASDGKLDKIASVEVIPALSRPPTRAKSSWWISFSGTPKGDYVLRVSYRGDSGTTIDEVKIVVE
ncbi:hypothetical protein BH09MYX1_BH09MYX1_04290 [soil metagenome]